MKMKKFLLALIMVLSVFAAPFSATVQAQQSQGNDYPIIFVHGLTGWGPDELGPFSYWGGLTGDIPRLLNQQGFRAYEASVGPFSSNRHRAIELYYFIKGGTVDYGAYSAYKFNHERFGRTFPGILPEWDDATRIHLVGHSMGGLTARELSNLIANGCQDEIAFAAANPEVEISALLAGETTGGIHSITTIATPNNGMSATEDHLFMPFVRTFVNTVASLSGVVPERNLYDFKLDQFGLSRDRGESFTSYMNRVFSSSIWRTEAVATHSLSVRGVTENAANLQTLPDIYYFSHSVQSSERVPIIGTQRMLLSTNPLFIPTGLFQIGYRDSRSTPRIDSSWAANDGLVNTVSMPYPFGHPNQAYNGTPVRGAWNYHPTMHAWDHLDIVGIGTRPQSQVNQFYLDIARRLHSLPE